MSSYISLHKSLKNPPIQKQPTVDQPYEYNYLLPVISSGSSVTSTQNLNVATNTSIAITFTDVGNNVVMIPYSAGNQRPHGYIDVILFRNSSVVDNLQFLVNESTGTITIFKTEIIDQIRVTNQTGVTLGMGLFAGVGTQITPPSHPYV